MAHLEEVRVRDGQLVGVVDHDGRTVEVAAEEAVTTVR